MAGSGSQGVAKGHMRDGASQGGVKVVRHTYHAHPAPHAQSGRLLPAPPAAQTPLGWRGGAFPRARGAFPRPALAPPGLSLGS